MSIICWRWRKSAPMKTLSELSTNSLNCERERERERERKREEERHNNRVYLH